MDELVEIWDSTGKPTGRVALKSDAHKNGWFHPTVHIWFYTASGQILLQKRALTKDTFPGLWDVSVAGHLGAGEDPVNGATREIREEIGVEIEKSELKQIGIHKATHRHGNAILDCEYHHIYISRLNFDLKDLKPQLIEVADLAFFPIAVLKNGNLGSEAKMLVPHGANYYETILTALSSVL